jgi:hypothetical protein
VRRTPASTNDPSTRQEADRPDGLATIPLVRDLRVSEWCSDLPEPVRARVVRALALAAGELIATDAVPNDTHSIRITVQGEGAVFNCFATRVEAGVVSVTSFDQGFHRDLTFDPNAQQALLRIAQEHFATGSVGLPRVLRPSYLRSSGGT